LGALGQAARAATRSGLREAVHRHRPHSKAGLSERLFTFAFRGLVYPQIWEDPLVDLEALALEPKHRVLAIASGGCNVFSYLTANPAEIVAVDLNGAHVALGRLKQCALKSLSADEFRAFFAGAASRANIRLYDRKIKARLDATTRAYWDGRRGLGRRRIGLFARNLYANGLLGRFIGAAHLLARLYRVDLAEILAAETLDEQRRVYERRLAKVFDKGFVRWLARRPASLFGLGIPPAQYRALSGGSEEGIVTVLRERVERLACGFPVKDNYFAWQAFARRYDQSPGASLPPYLAPENFEAIRAGADRVRYVHGSLTKLLAESRAASFDRYVLLDAQDWMNDDELTALWAEITRTARASARVIFRTAAAERLLPGRVPDDILGSWRYEAETSRRLGARDRSSIYGAFHLYVKKG